MKWTTHCPSLLTSSSVAGHTNTSVVSPGGRLKSPGCRDLCKTPDRATAYEAAAHVHSEAETQFAAARREKGTTVRRIARNSPMGSRSVLLEDDWRAGSRNRIMASIGNFESSRALSFAFID